MAHIPFREREGHRDSAFCYVFFCARQVTRLPEDREIQNRDRDPEDGIGAQFFFCDLDNLVCNSATRFLCNLHRIVGKIGPLKLETRSPPLSTWLGEMCRAWLSRLDMRSPTWLPGPQLKLFASGGRVIRRERGACASLACATRVIAPPLRQSLLPRNAVLILGN